MRALFLKRCMDLCLAIFLLIVLSPLFALVALIIPLDSDGPVFYRQIRIGMGRRPFLIWKFRTMVRDASEDRHRDFVLALMRGSEPTRPASKLVDDPRITRVGRWLRRSSFDELPQLFNVVRGEMSLIGPRPPVLYEYEAYQPWQLERFEMPQGMTGLWQVSDRNRVTYRRMHELDIEYVRHWSLWLDVKILVATLRAVVVDGEPIG
jgi:lipopolysaccharide/colanic/teichoic acid biosynthesis glycosyltransferase